MKYEVRSALSAGSSHEVIWIPARSAFSSGAQRFGHDFIQTVSDRVTENGEACASPEANVFRRALCSTCYENHKRLALEST